MRAGRVPEEQGWLMLDGEDQGGFPERGIFELNLEKCQFSSDTGAPQEAHRVWEKKCAQTGQVLKEWCLNTGNVGRK